MRRLESFVNGQISKDLNESEIVKTILEKDGAHDKSVLIKLLVLMLLMTSGM